MKQSMGHGTRECSVLLRVIGARLGPPWSFWWPGRPLVESGHGPIAIHSPGGIIDVYFCHLSIL